MPNTTTSQFMGLPVPVVSVDPGTQYATDVNTCLTTIDQHDHSTGKGTPVNPAGLNINSDLSMGINNLTNTRTVRFSSLGIPSTAAVDINCAYVSGVDLYYTDSNGNKIQLTKSGSVAGTAGSIGNLVSPANVTYSSGTQTYVFQSSSATAGNIDGGSYIMRNITASSNSITLAPPTSLAGNYTVTFPQSPLIASTSILTINGSGQLALTNSTAVLNAVPGANASQVFSSSASNFTFSAGQYWQSQIVLMTTGSSGFTATLPSPTSNFGRYTVKKTDIGAGTVKVNYPAGITADIRQPGDISLAAQQDFATFQSDGTNYQIISKVETSYLTTQSSEITFATIGTGNYGALTGNSISLGVGKWRVSGYFLSFNASGTNNFLTGGSGFYAANGANSASQPTALSNTFGTVTFGQAGAGGSIGNGATANTNFQETATVSFTIVNTASQSVFLVPQVNAGVGTGNPALTAVLWAERIW